MSLENNNNNDRNKKEKKSLYQIMDKQGFYIILILCVAIIAATAVWVNNQKEDYFIGEGPTNPFEEDMQPEVTLVEDNEAVEETDDAQETGKIGQGKPVEEDEKSSDTPKNQVKQDGKDNKEDIQKDSDKEEKVEETVVPEASEEASASVSMMVPVVGKLTLPFADDYLVYHKTLDQWSTHKGIDIQATEGSPVKAALDGEIVEVINDTIMGITITIKHNDDMLTRYSNLSTDAMVKVGDQVEKGQTISGVGKTASNKTLEGPLLHFQVLKNDKFIDPQIYLGKLNK